MGDSPVLADGGAGNSAMGDASAGGAHYAYGKLATHSSIRLLVGSSRAKLVCPDGGAAPLLKPVRCHCGILRPWSRLLLSTPKR